jgi:hypothetical protein
MEHIFSEFFRDCRECGEKGGGTVLAQRILQKEIVLTEVRYQTKDEG